MYRKPYDKLAPKPQDKRFSLPAQPALRAVSYSGVLDGIVVGPGDVVRLDPMMKRGARRAGPETRVCPQVFHRLKAALGSKFEEV